MSNSVQLISLYRLSIILLPVAVVLFIHYKWSTKPVNAMYALLRMLTQFLIVGYFLVFTFEASNYLVILTILAVMLFFASWISLRTVPERRKSLYLKAFISLAVGGGIMIFIVTQLVLDLEPWFWPRYMVPLAGMIFANSMNSISLASERFFVERGRGESYEKSRNIAYSAALIPVVNSLFAVGLVSLPGMMTGQILSGVSPLIAVRYQIMVMAMIFGAAGISTALFLELLKDKLKTV